MQSNGTTQGEILPDVIAFPENPMNKLPDCWFIYCFLHLYFVYTFNTNATSFALLRLDDGGKHCSFSFPDLYVPQLSSGLMFWYMRERISRVQHGGGKACMFLV